MIAEYWADGPHTELPSGHWDLFAQYVSRRDHHGTGRSGIAAGVKLFFALTNAILDASIVAWDDKRTYDSVRPITANRYLIHGQQVLAWAGPYQGTRLIDGGDWLPYQPSTFPRRVLPNRSVRTGVWSRGSPSWVFMQVDVPTYNGPIKCMLQVEDGSTVAFGTFTVKGGTGQFSKSIASVDVGHLRGAKLVTSSGSSVAAATFAA